MQLIEQYDHYSEWQSSYNSGKFVIVVKQFKDDSENSLICSVMINDHLVFCSEQENITVQNATDKAVKYLNQLNNLLKNCGFGN